MRDAPKKVQVDPADVLNAWFKARVVSSFKCKPEQADTMMNNETSRVAIDTFFNNETCSACWSSRILIPRRCVRRDATPGRAAPSTARPRERRRPSSSVHAVGSDPFVDPDRPPSVRDRARAPSRRPRRDRALTPAQSLPSRKTPSLRTAVPQPSREVSQEDAVFPEAERDGD